MLTTVLILLAVLFDQLIPHPLRFYPVAVFNRYTFWLERVLYDQQAPVTSLQALRGMLAGILAVGPVALLSYWLCAIPIIGYLVELMILYLALGIASLNEHVRLAATALHQDRLDEARQRVAMLSGYDTRTMSRSQLITLCIEALFINSVHAAVAIIFWFIVAGGVGVVIYRLMHILATNWSVDLRRYVEFGRFVSFCFSLLTWFPARLTAGLYLLVGQSRQAWLCWRRQAGFWSMLYNSVVLASAGGASNLLLTGAVPYQGLLKERATYGYGSPPEFNDIERSVLLFQKSLWTGLVLLFVSALLITAYSR